MTTFAGGVLPSGVKGDPAYALPEKFLPAPFRPYEGAIARFSSGGFLTNLLPVSELPVGFAGFTIRQFEQHWYHQIHLLPGKIILGNLLSGSAEYFLFGGDGYCYCVTQYTSTIYNMLLFGTMTKTCSFTGGAFLSDSYSGAVRADIDSATNAWKTANGSGNTSSRMFYTSLTRQLDSYSPITFNGVTPLYPITVEVGRTTPTYYYSMVGYIPEARLLRMNGQYANKDIVTLGSDEWMVFSTSYGGYAFKK